MRNDSVTKLNDGGEKNTLATGAAPSARRAFRAVLFRDQYCLAIRIEFLSWGIILLAYTSNNEYETKQRWAL